MFLFQGEGKLSRRNYRIGNVPSRSRNWNTQLKNKQRKYTGQDIIRRGCSSCRRSPSLCSQPSWNNNNSYHSLSISAQIFNAADFTGEREKFSKWNYDSIRARFYIIYKTHAFCIDECNDLTFPLGIHRLNKSYRFSIEIDIVPFFRRGERKREKCMELFVVERYINLFQPFSIPVANRHRYACISNRRGNSTVREENTRQFSYSFPDAPSFAKDGFF